MRRCLCASLDSLVIDPDGCTKVKRRAPRGIKWVINKILENHHRTWELG